jgi:hypothetical protein
MPKQTHQQLQSAAAISIIIIIMYSFHVPFFWSFSVLKGIFLTQEGRQHKVKESLELPLNPKP